MNHIDPFRPSSFVQTLLHDFRHSKGTDFDPMTIDVLWLSLTRQTRVRRDTTEVSTEMEDSLKIPICKPVRPTVNSCVPTAGNGPEVKCARSPTSTTGYGTLEQPQCASERTVLHVQAGKTPSINSACRRKNAPFKTSGLVPLLSIFRFKRVAGTDY